MRGAMATTGAGEYESVIGLEVHAQLRTATKIFCGCPATHVVDPNTAVCAVCLGLPGALPVLNAAAVDLAIRAALALGCVVHEWSAFARKHYFYPDLPKGYQITQFDRPLATDGRLPPDLAGPDYPVRIERVHIEEDAGKSLHPADQSGGTTTLDFNRAGVPLVEIVTRPDLRSPADAAMLFRRLRELLVATGVNDGNLELGSLRCDANISVRRRGEVALGAKTELKNLNSFRFLQRAIDHEVARQAGIVAEGGRVVSETRLWDGVRTVPMRSKEEEPDYRYFPEPDLPPLHVVPERVAAIAAALPALPGDRRAALVTSAGLSEADAVLFTLTYPGLDRYWEEAAEAAGDRRAAANWIRGEVVGAMREHGLGDAEALEARVPARQLGRLIRLLADGRLSGPTARTLFEAMAASGGPLETLLAAAPAGRLDDETAIASLVEQIVSRHPAALAEYRAGRTKVLGFFVGQVMRASGGRANTRLVNDLVRRALDGDR